MMSGWISGEEPGIEHLSFEEKLPYPEYKPGHVLVRVEAAALNYSDLLMVSNTYQVKPPRPFIPGQEIAGTIIATKPDSNLKEGQRIAAKVFWGGFAEYVLVREDMAIPLPDHTDFATGAALPVVYITAMVALDGLITADKTVLIHAAAGGVGLASVEIARHAGATIIATAGSEEKLNIAKEHGADFTINYRDDDWSDQVKQITKQQGVDIVADPVGGDVAIQSLRCMARFGTLLVVGFASGDITKIPSNRLLLKSLSAKGILWSHDQDGPLVERLQNQLVELLNERKINPLVNQDYSLAELPKALEALKNRSSVGKIILRCGSN